MGVTPAPGNGIFHTKTGRWKVVEELSPEKADVLVKKV